LPIDGWHACFHLSAERRAAPEKRLGAAWQWWRGGAAGAIGSRYWRGGKDTALRRQRSG
jgi:hypothetical protein